MIQVSIPFKRESVFQEVIAHSDTEGPDGFQFPSNGKAYSKGECYQRWHKSHQVSIPFKRESVFQVDLRIRNLSTKRLKVSIPFKRESVFQVGCSSIIITTLTLCFNSLQTGKRIPSTGRLHLLQSDAQRVSIPFKRESVFQEDTASL